VPRGCQAVSARGGRARDGHQSSRASRGSHSALRQVGPRPIDPPRTPEHRRPQVRHTHTFAGEGSRPRRPTAGARRSKGAGKDDAIRLTARTRGLPTRGAPFGGIDALIRSLCTPRYGGSAAGFGAAPSTPRGSAIAGSTLARSVTFAMTAGGGAARPSPGAPGTGPPRVLCGGRHARGHPEGDSGA